jgi:hypothetical protein
MVESPSHLREHPQPTKLALLCALLVLREREVTDTLAQLLISTIHRINAHAEQKVVEEFVKDFRRVRGKDTMLRKIAEASLRGWSGRREAPGVARRGRLSPVSSRPPSNRACGSPAHGSPTFFTAGIQRPVRHGRFGRGATMVPLRLIRP